MAPRTSLGRQVTRAGAACFVFLAAPLGCGGEVLNLGSSGLQAGGAGGTAGGSGGVVGAHVWDLHSTPIFEQKQDLLLANPTLADNGNELFYSVQERFGNPEPHLPYVERAVWNGSAWGNVAKLTFGELKDPDISSPAISAASTELWLGMYDPDSGNTDIFKSMLQAGAWTTPLRVAELSSTHYDDAPRQPAVGGTIMPLSSKRHGGPLPVYQIYLSTRENENAVWSEPSKALLGPVNSDEFQSADGFLNITGLELYFSSKRDGTDSDLYVSRRASIRDVFGAPEPLIDLNDPEGRSEERMPWLSPDGQNLYFVSDRTGQYTLYLATKAAP